MPNSLFTMFGNDKNNMSGNILKQLAQIKRNPGAILDIMLQNGKIDYQQYNELQQYKNNPEMIVQYLMNKGKSNEINQSQQMANSMMNKIK